MMLAQGERITVDEFARLIALPENANRKLELFNGEIIEKMPSKIHASLAFRIAYLLGVFLESHPIGRGLIEQRVSLPDQPNHDLIPDVAFVAQGRINKHDDEGVLSFMPDLCIEIQSPGQTVKLLTDKAAYYLAHGARMVWLIYPAKGVVEWLTPTERHLLVGEDAVAGGEVLPGFSVTVAGLLTLP